MRTVFVYFKNYAHICVVTMRETVPDSNQQQMKISDLSKLQKDLLPSEWEEVREGGYLPSNFFDAFISGYTREGQPTQNWRDPSDQLAEYFAAYYSDKSGYIFIFASREEADAFYREWEAEQVIHA